MRDGTAVAVQRITLQIELDPQSSPFTGAIAPDGGERVPFVGWLGLAEVLERVLIQARDAARTERTAAEGPSATIKGGTNDIRSS